MNQFANMSLKEMLDLNHALCAAIRQKRTQESVNKIGSFTVGDRIRWNGSTKRPGFNGTVTKVLRTNVDVISDDGQPWLIPAASLVHI